jgi:hypothetical protein
MQNDVCMTYVDLNCKQNRNEQNLFTMHWSLTDLTQRRRTCRSTNTIFVSDTNIHKKQVHGWVIYTFLVLQYYISIITTRNHHHCHLHLLMIAQNF